MTRPHDIMSAARISPPISCPYGPSNVPWSSSLGADIGSFGCEGIALRRGVEPFHHLLSARFLQCSSIPWTWRVTGKSPRVRGWVHEAITSLQGMGKHVPSASGFDGRLFADLAERKVRGGTERTRSPCLESYS